jgi:NAD(P)-dependent dehydrogenase (short-subunit alcohol dehydrogenase family)
MGTTSTEAILTQKVLITGVHTGLGRALAGRYLQNGATVTGLSRQAPEGLSQTDRFTFYRVDFLEQATLEAQLQSTIGNDGGYDLVFLNAGVLGGLKRLEAFSFEEIQRVMMVNVWANKMLIDRLLAGVDSPKQIIAMSSGAAIYGSTGWGMYSISKAALNCLIRVAAAEWPYCHFCTLAPGLVDTPMLQSIYTRAPNPDFPGDTQIRESRKNGLVQSPADAATRISDIAAALKGQPSGGYYDIRELPFDVR